MSTNIPENLSEGGAIRDRSICFSVANLLGITHKNQIQAVQLWMYYKKYDRKNGSLMDRVHKSTQLSIKRPYASTNRSFHESSIENKSFFRNQTIQLADWIFADNTQLGKEFQKRLHFNYVNYESKGMNHLLLCF